MRKRLLCVYIFFILLNTLRAQPYVPMLDSINVWNHAYQHVYVIQNPTPQSVFNFERTRLQTNGDTIIDSIAYKKLWALDVLPFQYAPDLLKGFVRENTAQQKIYFRTPSDTDEFLAYDFSLNIGDSIYLRCPIFCNPSEGYFQLESIQLRNTTSGPKREFRLEPLLPNCGSDTAHWFVWLEGIGNLIEFTYWDLDFNLWMGAGDFMYSDTWLCGIENPQYDYPYFLTCFEHSNKVYFDTCSYNIINYTPSVCNLPIINIDSCTYAMECGGSVEELTSISEIRVFPVPSTAFITIDATAKIAVDCDLHINDIKGSLVFELLKNKLVPGKNLITLELPQLNPGFYTLTIEEHKGIPLTRKILIQ